MTGDLLVMPPSLLRLFLVTGFAVILGVRVAMAQVLESPSLNTHQAFISIIVDDLGHQMKAGLRAIGLPGPVTYAILPHTVYAQRIAELAHRLDKEILLHLPMEANGSRNLGLGGLTREMTRHELVATFYSDLGDIPHAIGINNHMGSLLTRHSEPMQWLMEAIRAYGNLFFVDSRTTPYSVAERVASDFQVPVIRRDVFLDHERDAESILNQFRFLVAQAKVKGIAVGIAHPYPETLAVLETVLHRLELYGVKLAPISTLVQNRGQASRVPTQLTHRQTGL